jgi:hypothetical protein
MLVQFTYLDQECDSLLAISTGTSPETFFSPTRLEIVLSKHPL